MNYTSLVKQSPSTRAKRQLFFKNFSVEPMPPLSNLAGDVDAGSGEEERRERGRVCLKTPHTLAGHEARVFITGSIAPPPNSRASMGFGFEQEGEASGLLLCILLFFSVEFPQPPPHDQA